MSPSWLTLTNFYFYEALVLTFQHLILRNHVSVVEGRIGVSRVCNGKYVHNTSTKAEVLKSCFVYIHT